METFSRKQKARLSLMVMSLLLTGGMGIGTDSVYAKTITKSEVLEGKTVASAQDPNVEARRIASIYNRQGPITVDMNGQELLISTTSKNADYEVYGIFADGQSIQIQNGKEGFPIRITATGKNDAHGIYAIDGGNVRIDHDVAIEKVEYKMGAYGIFSGRGNSEVTMNGQFTINKSVSAPSRRLNHAYGAAAVDGGKISFLKPVSIDIDGTAFQTFTDTSEIHVAGGDVRVGMSLVPKKKYYVADASKGTIYLNMQDQKNPGQADLTLKGNIIAAGKTGHLVHGGNIYMGLTTKNSSWLGIVDRNVKPEEEYKGNFDIHLANGATWNHKSLGTPNDNFSESLVTSLHGGASPETAGVLVQREKVPISIENYDGHTLVMYKHKESEKDGATGGLQMIGGDIRIAKAAPGSAITLRTDSVGLSFDTEDEESKSLIKGTLDSLANKLYYTANDGNLKGKVEIAEGLTAQSASKRLEDMTFKAESGQGEYKYTLEEFIPEEQTETKFTVSITGVKAQDMLYVKSGVLKADMIYHFTKDSEVTISSADSAVDGMGNDITIDATGKTLNLTSEGKGGTVLASTVNQQGHVLSVKADTVNVKMKHTDGSWASGINVGSMDVHTPTTATFEGNVNIEVEGSGTAMGTYLATDSTTHVTGDLRVHVNNLRPKAGHLAHYHTVGVYAGWGNAKLTVGGAVDIYTNGTGIEANAGSRIDIAGGGKIRVAENAKADHYAVESEASQIFLNVKASTSGEFVGVIQRKLNIEGNIGLLNKKDGQAPNAEDVKADIYLGLGVGGSSLKGIILNEYAEQNVSNHGAAHLYLYNGALWTNESVGKVKDGFTGSRLNLEGGATAATRGVVVQNDANPITIDKYSGHTLFIYNHEMADDMTRENHEAYGNKIANMVGGDVRIGHGADDSVVTLRTDATGLNTEENATWQEKNLVNDTLDRLANKLFYTANDGKLKGKVEIAEGLTAQSVSKRLEDITFKTANGQGEYKYTLEHKPVPDHQVVNPMTDAIDGTSSSEEAYTDAGILKDGIYKFTENPADIDTDADTAITGENKDITAQAPGTLNLKAAQKGIRAGNGKAVDITAPDTNVLDGQVGMEADEGSIAIHGNTGIKSGETGLKANGQNGMITVDGDTVIQSDKDGIVSTQGGSVILKGMTNLNATGDAIRADEGSVIVGSKEGVQNVVKGNVVANNRGHVSLDNADTTGDVKAMGTGSTVTLEKGKVTGNLDAEDEGTITANLEGENNGLTGDVTGNGNIILNLRKGAMWTGKSSNAKTNVTLESTWKQTGDSTVNTLNAKSAILDKTGADAGTTSIENYQGHMLVIYKHEIVEDTTSPHAAHFHNKAPKIIGGNTRIGTAAEGSMITLRTDNTGLNMTSKRSYDLNLVNETLNQMANKLEYTANDGKLKGKVEIAEGLTAQSASKRLEDMTFNANGMGEYKYTLQTEDNAGEIIYGPKETAMMRGAKSAMGSSLLLWRAENNDIEKRMGDLKDAAGQDGAWGRLYGGKMSSDVGSSFDTTFKGIQAGYDVAGSNGRHTGVAISYIDGNASYEKGGKGDPKMTSLALYMTQLKNDGTYYDLIVKGSKVDNEYTVYNDMGHKLEGDFDTWGMTGSLEAGKRMKQANGSILTPYAQIVYGHANGSDYDAVSDFSGGKKMHVQQDDFNSLIGRIGIRYGMENESASYYLKTAVAHEFAGEMKSTFSAENEPTSSTEMDFSDTWLEVALGGTRRVGDNFHVYGQVEKSFGGDTKTDWRVDAGVRLSF